MGGRGLRPKLFGNKIVDEDFSLRNRAVAESQSWNKRLINRLSFVDVVAAAASTRIITVTELQAQNCTRHMHKKVCSDQGRRSGNRHVDLHVVPTLAQCGGRSATLPWTLFLWVCCSRTTFPGCFDLSKKFSDGRSYFKRAWPKLCCRIHIGSSNKRWYPMTGYVFAFCGCNLCHRKK